MYWSEAYGAHATWGGIAECYERLHGIGSPLGFPTTDEQQAARSPQGTEGYYQQFENGAICRSEKYGAQALIGPLAKRYLDLGGTRSELGFPIGDANGPTPARDSSQQFEGGWL
ncbi:MAG: LGFP repeat-containing protein [Dehalococcoidia bacterium]